MLKTIVLAASALVVAGCGGSADGSNMVAIKGDEYAFVMPDTIEGGWTTLEFHNTGRDLHEFALAKLTSGKTVEDVHRYLADPKAQEQPPPSWVEIRAGIPTVDAGEKVSLTQQLSPGRYVLLCFLPASDGRSHIEHGMLREFTVEGDAGADAPEPDTTLALGPSLAAAEVEGGATTLELRNDEDEPQAVFLIALDEGKTENDLVKWEEGGLHGPAPASFLGGAIDVPPGTSVYYELELEEGREYTLIDDANGIETSFTPGVSR